MISLVAAPLGARVGLTAARVGGRQVLITVAPKAWRVGPPRTIDLGAEHDRPFLSIGLNELDRLTIRGASGSDLVEAVLAASRRMVDGVPTWDSSLLAPEVVRSKFRSAGPVVEALPGPTTDLLRLFEHVDLLSTSVEDVQGRLRWSPLHRPLLYRRFLREVASRMSTARPSYRSVTELRTTVRGRIAPASLAALRTGQSTKLECTYSELTASTPLLEVIVTALEWVADGKGAHSLLPDPFSDLRLRRDAVTVRRAISEVAALPVLAALRLGRRLRLGRLDRAWNDALRMAIAVLAECEPVPAEVDASDADAVELSVATDKLWERIVAAALARAGFDHVLQPTHQPPGMTSDPWVRQHVWTWRTYPDNIALNPGGGYIVDAKYKTRSPGSDPQRGDQYQMFAYSHLVSAAPRMIRAAILVYPGSAPVESWLRGRDHAVSPVRLHVLGLPFPASRDLADATAWSRYLDGLGSRLERELGLAEDLSLHLSA